MPTMGRSSSAEALSRLRLRWKREIFSRSMQAPNSS